jgi:pilus assembly protein CpaB
MAFAKLNINSNWLLLLVAGALGIGAVYMSNSMLKNRMAELEEEARRGQEMVDVVVGKRDLAPGDTLDADSVAVRQMPKAYVHEAAVRPNQFDAYANQRLAAGLKRGEVLLPSLAEGQAAGVFSSTLTKGLRALTFEVDAVNSVSGMLRPGDRIDLIYSASAAGGGLETTAPLLSNVSVLATDQTLSRRSDGSDGARNFATITLELSPVDADRVIVAKAAGRLTALLRHPDDTAVNNTASLSAAHLIGAEGAQAGVRGVEYIVGGGGGIATLQLDHP